MPVPYKASGHEGIPVASDSFPGETVGSVIARTRVTVWSEELERQARVRAKAGLTRTLRPRAAGDTVVENPELAHYGANNGTEDVVIYAASLFPVGAAPADPLPSNAP